MSDIKLHTLVHLRESMNPIDFEVKRSKVRSQTGHMNIPTAQYLENPLFDGH
jgi:hypothetical protein